MRFLTSSKAQPSFSLALLALGLFNSVQAIFLQQLCSSQNTGTDGPHLSKYQSCGACHTTCAGYSYGIVQDENCWCSNEQPADTVDVSNCNQNCPGYPYEQCGNSDNSLYGYIYLGKEPQGTADGSGGAATSPASSPTQQPGTTVVTWTPTPSPSILTVSGSIKTVVVTPTKAPQATTTVAVNGSSSDQPSSPGFFDNKGAVAGVFTVVGLAVVAGIAAVLFSFWRWKRQDKEGSERLQSMEEDRNSMVPSTFMSRRTSELALRTDVPRVGTSDEKTPTSLHLTGTQSRRTSMPLTDQRLNPNNLFHDNGSHVSVASLQDNQDYSRPVLQVANPDRPGSSAIADD